MTALLRPLPLAALLGLAACASGPREEPYNRPAASAPQLALDHGWIAVRDPTAEGARLEQAGFRVSDGRRIAFENGYLDLVSSANPAAAPFGLAFRRTAATPADLAFAAPSAAPAVALAIEPQGVDEAGNRAAIAAGGAAAEPFLHTNGARRITGLRVTAPTRAALPPAASFVNLSGAAELRVGTEWLMELELDNGSQNQELDLRPRLPLVVRF
jgi:hypothetical protein